MRTIITILVLVFLGILIVGSQDSCQEVESFSSPTFAYEIIRHRVGFSTSYEYHVTSTPMMLPQNNVHSASGHGVSLENAHSSIYAILDRWWRFDGAQSTSLQLFQNLPKK